MKKTLVIITLLIAVVYACNQNDKTASHLLNTGNLTTQLFKVKIDRDTTLITKKGAIIRIPQGALSSADTTVQLEVKEAYSMKDIIAAGLITQSNGQPLSSGGMIYINAKGSNTVKITKAISVATPTEYLDKDMKLFKGEVNSNGTINWTDPQAMPVNPQLNALEAGKLLFTNNCTSCHSYSLDKELTGPALAHVMKRLLPYTGEGGPVSHPYAFTRNPAKEMAHGGYYRCLKNKYGVMMTPFPSLTNEELDKLYGYIENESNHRHLPVPDNGILKCVNSCRAYIEIASKWKTIKERLEKDSTDMLKDIRDLTPPSIDTILPEIDTTKILDRLNLVQPNYNKSLYYQFTIESFGWYNVDILLKDCTNAISSELSVRIQGQYKERFNIYLIIPSIKALIPGGPLSNKPNSYGFYEDDGSIPLPQNQKAFILALGEYEDQIIFAKKEFTTQQKQNIDLQLAIVSKEVFQKEVAALNLSDISINANDTKNAAELRTAIKEMKKAEQLKPKNCDCDCFLNENNTRAINTASEIDYPQY